MNLEETTLIYVYTFFGSPEKSKSKSFHKGFLRKGGKFKSIEWIIIYLSKNCRFSWSKKRPSWNDFGFDFFGLPQHVGTWIGVHFGRFISKLLIPFWARGAIYSWFLFIRRRFVTEWLSRIKILNIHCQWSLPDPKTSATSLKINFQILDFDT